MDNAKKKRIKKYITWGVMAAVVALLALMPLLARSEAEADGPVASILSATVEKGTITTALHGGGTIAAEDVEEIKLPEGVKITEFLVKNGQFVTEGTPLVAVDKVSVMTAITEVSETLDYLREELEGARNEKIASNITATAGGRVKKIFAQPGDAVQDVMLRNGALAVLSLDGLMAVKLEQDLPLSTGESVTVTLADGEEVTGRVESNLDGVVIITVEDEGYEIGQIVKVSLDGESLGEGSLYIHNAWKATAYSGTIENVNTKEEKTVSSGATLFTLKDRDYEGELRRRSGQHREYEELLQRLFQMYETGIIAAPCDGEVEGVDKDSAHLLSAVPDGWVIAPLNNTAPETGEKGYRVLLLTHQEDDAGTGNSCTDDPDCPLTWEQHITGNYPTTCPSLCQECQGKVRSHNPNCITKCTGLAGCPNANDPQYHNPGCKSLCTGKPGCEAPMTRHSNSCPEKCTNDAYCKRSFQDGHGNACITRCVRDTDPKDATVTCDARTHYPQCIENCTEGQSCNAINHKVGCYYYGVSYTACVGIVKEASSGTIKYKYAAEFSQVTAIRDANGMFTITVKPDFKIMNSEGFVASNTPCNPGDVILIITGVNAKGNVVMQDQVYVYDSSSLPGIPSFGLGGLDLSKLIGGFSGFGNYYPAIPEEESEPLFDLDGTTLLTVTPYDTATLVIDLDEHDIAKVTKGMKATVKIEALKGAEFPAEVTAIAAVGTNNGGSSKFQVELTFTMTPEMLSGMSAAAIIPLEEKEVLQIPAAAITQQGGKTMVYTALDEEGNPTSPIEVTLGISDGEYVEVVSGLELGQSVYYAYYDTVELDTSAEAEKYSFG